MRTIFLIAVTGAWAAASTVGCIGPNVRPDPLAGWTPIGSITWNGLKTPGKNPPPLPDAITNDYEDYIRKLPVHKGTFASRSESYFITRVAFYHDNTGRHAVEIRIPLQQRFLRGR